MAKNISDVPRSCCRTRTPMETIHTTMIGPRSLMRGSWMPRIFLPPTASWSRWSNRYEAKKNARNSLANSPGWNWPKPGILIQMRAPFTFGTDKRQHWRQQQHDAHHHRHVRESPQYAVIPQEHDEQVAESTSAIAQPDQLTLERPLWFWCLGRGVRSSSRRCPSIPARKQMTDWSACGWNRTQPHSPRWSGTARTNASIHGVLHRNSPFAVRSNIWMNANAHCAWQSAT